MALEYLDALDLGPQDIFAKNSPEIVKRLGERASDHDTIKHLADSLDLHASSLNELGHHAGLARLHAMKFYEIAFAVSSVVREGQEIVDDFLGMLRDAAAARKFIEETLLPIIRRFKLLGHLVSVRGQYAVVLAYCGSFDLARSELGQLKAFEGSLDDKARAELHAQEELLHKIEQGEVGLGPPVKPDATPPYAQFLLSGTESKQIAKVGRNQPCPCGSGKKYKRCHGR